MRNQRGFVWWIYLIAAGVVLAAVVGIVWKIHNTGYEKGRAEIQLKWDQAVQDQREKERVKIDTATTKHEAQREKTKVVYRTIRQNVDRVITKEIYKNLCFEAEGLKSVNNALSGVIKSGEPSATTPGPP